jgi:predicted RNase H-like HicB family nuclease
MLTRYIEAAMGKAKYEILEDDGTYYGQIPGFRGVWANARSLEACRAELQEVLEDWILVALRRGKDLPHIKGIPKFPKLARKAG